MPIVWLPGIVGIEFHDPNGPFQIFELVGICYVFGSSLILKHKVKFFLTPVLNFLRTEAAEPWPCLAQDRRVLWLPAQETGTWLCSEQTGELSEHRLHSPVPARERIRLLKPILLPLISLHGMGRWCFPSFLLCSYNLFVGNQAIGRILQTYYFVSCPANCLLLPRNSLQTRDLLRQGLVIPGHPFTKEVLPQHISKTKLLMEQKGFFIAWCCAFCG